MVGGGGGGTEFLLSDVPADIQELRRDLKYKTAAKQWRSLVKSFENHHHCARGKHSADFLRSDKAVTDKRKGSVCAAMRDSRPDGFVLAV